MRSMHIGIGSTPPPARHQHTRTPAQCSTAPAASTLASTYGTCAACCWQHWLTLCRNEHLAQHGGAAPRATKTGTTIVGVIYKVGADKGIREQAHAA